MKKYGNTVILLLLLVCFSADLSAKVESLDVTGNAKLFWNRLNNGFDKTTTHELSTGARLYDDLDEFAYTMFSLKFNLLVMRNVTLALGLNKKDTLWASHNDYFNSEHNANLGEFIGDPSPSSQRNYKGIKIENLYIKADEIIWRYVNFTGGRQFYSGTVYEETDAIKDIPQDLFLYITGDGLVFNLSWDFLFFEPQMKSDFFAFKINDGTAGLYDSSGGFIWDRMYGDNDINLYGFINRITYKNNSFKSYLMFYDKGGKKLVQGDSNADGFDHRYLIGLNYTRQGVFTKYLKVFVEGGYELGRKAVGTYYDLDIGLDLVQKDYYGTARYNAYVYRAGLEYRQEKLAAALFHLGGSGDKPSTPGTIEGFYGLNEVMYGRTYGTDFAGYGEIFKASPYMHNSGLGSPVQEEDQRLQDPSVSRYPTGIIGANISYTIGTTGDDENKVVPMLEYFYYYNLPGNSVVAVNRFGGKYKAIGLGMEVDASVRYVYQNKLVLKFLYGLYLPGQAYRSGYDNIIQGETGKDPAELFKFQTELYF
ncbi:MAG: hypothetical protein PHF84_06495 [bacterium]|nr:hypothetical protein [bacterium]